MRAEFADVECGSRTGSHATSSERTKASLNCQAVDLADLLKAMAHPARWMLVSALMDSESSVTELEQCLLIHQPTLSQQLTVLRRASIAETRREGKKVFYRLGVGKTMQLIREISRIFAPKGRAFE